MAKRSRFLQHDKTEKVFTSPRQEGTYLYFTSRGDDLENQVRGAGTELVIDNSNDPQIETIIETQFIDDLFLKDGLISWENALIGDSISLEMVLPANVPFVSETQQGNANMIEGTVTHITASPAPDETWVGEYMLFPIDVVLFRFVNKFNILGTNYNPMTLQNADTAEIPKELKFKVTLHSDNLSPVKILINLQLYRTNTI